MSPEAVEAAYAPFAAALRKGGFREPEVGWPAELIAAHVALNNDSWTEAARAAAAGETRGYDNETAVDWPTLRAHADRLGSLAALADDVLRSARELAQVRAALSDAAAADKVHVVIHHEGGIIRDAPADLGQMIEGNATFHLDMHCSSSRRSS